MKKYKAPDSKYLVVVDPWGTPGHPCFIGNVAAWFELMLKDDYPDEDVKTIFTQGTHNNVIVELSESVDVLPYLGAHHHARFLTQPYNRTDNVSYIYEYDYETQNDPTRRGWTAKYPSGYDIKIFPIVQPYPPPLPAPPPPFHVGYAKRPQNIAVAPPPNVVFNQSPPSIVPIHKDIQLSTPLPNVETEDLRPNSVANSKKRDPYEEADEAERLLRTDVSRPSTSIKQEDGRQDVGLLGVKKEEPIVHHIPIPKCGQVDVRISAVDDFLDSIIPINKEEPVSHRSPLPKREPKDGVVFDSALPVAVVEREEHTHASLPHPNGSPSEQYRSEEDGYQPSADLWAAFAGLQPHVLNQSHSPTNTSSGTPTQSVKIEVHEGTSSDAIEQGRSTTLATETGDVRPSTVRVKPEPRDDYDAPPSDPRRIPMTRDPRVVQRDRSTTRATEPREAEQFTVRVKPEPREDHSIPPAHPVARTHDSRCVNPAEQSTARVKPEPREDHSIPPSQPVPRTRDPRLMSREQLMVGMKSEPRDDRSVPPSHPVPKTRDPRLVNRANGHGKHPLDDEHERGMTKRIKSEQ